MKKTTLLFIILFILCIGISGTSAKIVKFENFNNDKHIVEVPHYYEELFWHNAFIVDEEYDTNVVKGITSGKHCIINGNGNTIVIKKHTRFNWNGAWFSNISDEDNIVVIYGYRNGHIVYNTIINSEGFNIGKPYYYHANWKCIDKLMIISTNNKIFAIDDFNFNDNCKQYGTYINRYHNHDTPPAPVPEPATILMMGVGLLLLFIVMKKKGIKNEL